MRTEWNVDISPISMPKQLEPGPTGHSIAVAVNGGSSGWQALDWAAAEAAARRSTLRIVHVVVPPTVMSDPLGGAGPVWIDVGASEAGALVLEEAVRRAQQITPESVVTASLTCGALAAAISATSHDNALTVIGRGRPRRVGMTAASRRIARNVAGPLAIVELDEERQSGPSAGRVVIGIDGSAGPHAAVAYAFQAAARRGVGLTAIHACNAWITPLQERADKCRSLDSLRRLATIDDVLQTYRDAHPNVDVRRRFVHDSPSTALVAESKAAALLVIGVQPRGRLPRVLGSVARAALGRAACPIAMISASSLRHPAGRL
jgi:nucleotide-binding universal stress UspA family protein